MKTWKIKSAILGLICCFVLVLNVGCTSPKVKEAQDAYNQGDYNSVIQILERENIESGKAKELYSLANAHIYYDQKKYADSFLQLLSIDKNDKDDFYNEVVNGAIDSSLANANASEVINMIKAKSDISQTVNDKYSDEANKLNIKAFKCISDISNSDIDNETKSSYTNYLTDNKLNMPKAYILGKWQRVNDSDATKDVVYVRQQGDNIIGVFEVVGETSAEYQKKVGEITWKDFNFLDQNTITFTGLGKTRDGTTTNNAGYITVDYSNINSMRQTLTPTPPFTLSDADRVWQRIG